VTDQKATLPMWARVLAIVVGLLSLMAAGIVLLEPIIGLFVVVIFLGVALLFIGFDRLIAGITGHPYSWMGVKPVGPAGPTNGSTETPPPPR